jgi:hypothetical protein
VAATVGGIAHREVSSDPKSSAGKSMRFIVFSLGLNNLTKTGPGPAYAAYGDSVLN